MATQRKTTVTQGKTAPKRKYKPREIAVIPGWKSKQGHMNPHRPTERSRMQVEMMTAYGATQNQIAAAMDIAPKTLVNHYREQLTLGGTRANMAVASNLFRLATTEENTPAVVNAAIWWSKARMGWSEIRRTMSDVRTVSGNMRDLTDAQLINIIEGATIGEGGEGALPAPYEPGEFE